MEHHSILNTLLERVSTLQEEYGVVLKKRIANGKAVARLSIVCNDGDEIKTIYTGVVEDKSMEKAVHDVYFKALTYITKVGLYAMHEIRF